MYEMNLLIYFIFSGGGGGVLDYCLFPLLPRLQLLIN